MSDAAIFRRFVAAINDHEVGTILALMTPDHTFIDALGNRTQGLPFMESAWQTYFSMCPDYRIRVEDLLSDAGLVLATGEASGTIDGVAWQAPAAWKAVIRENSVAEWRVFVDNKAVYEILARRRSP